MNTQIDNILSAWFVTEVFALQRFRKESDLKDTESVIYFTDKLPWDNLISPEPKVADSNKSNDLKTFYHIILGRISVEKASHLFREKFGDNSIESIPTKDSFSIIAEVIVDEYGQLCGSIAVSSFVWGLQHALKKDFEKLRDWRCEESEIKRNLSVLLASENRKVTLDLIKKAFKWLVDFLNLPEGVLFCHPDFMIKTVSRNCPNNLLLNSFYLDDIEKAKKLNSMDQLPLICRKYLGFVGLENKVDILKDNRALSQLLAPQNISSAKWPSGSSLNLLQQVAVNLVNSKTEDNTIVSINGPPGTGKTTLLRDIIATKVTERAKAMCAFDDPKDAFSSESEEFWKLDDTIKGYEILIASSNNKAVENISKELPAISAVTDDSCRYLKTIADEINQKNCWGLIAVALGNAKNRGNFKEKFWFDNNTSLYNYLNCEYVKKECQKDGSPIPKIIENESSAFNRREALENWKLARSNFNQLNNEIAIKLDYLVKYKETVAAYEDVKNLLAESIDAIKKQEPFIIEATNNLESSFTAISNSEQQIVEGKELIEYHKYIKPCYLSSLIFRKNYKKWELKYSEYLFAIESGYDELHRLRSVQKQHHLEQNKCVACFRELESVQNDILGKKEKLEAVLTKYREEIDELIIDEQFLETSDRAKLYMSTPWLDDSIQKMREKLFVFAMKVHQAFMDVAAQPLKNNIARVLMGGNTPDILPDLWSSLFLVIPCISTTFASVNSMLRYLPPQSIGMLMIDEAGQASPQMAIGALMHSKQAVVVGDPKQIEPITTLPRVMEKLIFKEFGVTEERFTEDEVSVQTLADFTMKFGTKFSKIEKEVGIPLLVHRRCSDPMFSISNKIAYGGLMVNAKKPSKSRIRDCLGKSYWLDVQSDESVDKWSVREGKVVARLLSELVKNGIPLNLYIISPFKNVAFKLKKLLLNKRLCNYEWCDEHVGTVHTAQGKEEEAVIFVLGANDPDDLFARNWAAENVNLINVAVTRAKEAIYIVGDKEKWGGLGLFSKINLPSQKFL